MPNSKPKTLEGCLDILGEPIMTGDYIAYSRHEYNDLFTAKVIGWTAKNIRISDLNNNYTPFKNSHLILYYKKRCIKIPKLMIMRLKMGLDLKELKEEDLI